MRRTAPEAMTGRRQDARVSTASLVRNVAFADRGTFLYANTTSNWLRAAGTDTRNVRGVPGFRRALKAVSGR